METVSIITIAYNGYGKFIPKWLEGVEKQTIKPKEIIIVLGKDHGLKEIPSDVKVVNYDKEATKGYLMNLGVKASTSYYSIVVDVDDELLSNAVEEVQKVDADIVGLRYYLNGEIQETPEIKAEHIHDWKNKYGGASGYLATRRGLEYEDTLCAEWALLYKAYQCGLTFKNTEKPCAIYKKRPDSHSAIGNYGEVFKELEIYAKKYLI